MTALLVALGAAVGAPTRFLVDRLVPRQWGTLLVNVLGSLLLGLFAGLAAHPYALLGTGFCGAFTTYSAFAVEVVEGAGARYVALSAVLCLSAAALGLALS